MLNAQLPGGSLTTLDFNFGVVNVVALFPCHYVSSECGLLAAAAVQGAAQLKVETFAATAVLVVPVDARHGLDVVVIAGGNTRLSVAKRH